MTKPRLCWAVMWRSDNQLDGDVRHLLHVGYLPALFRTRRAAREYIEDQFGYLRERADLKTEPHGWKLPVPVKVEIKVIQ